MKKIFIILAVAAAAVACLKEEMTTPSLVEGQTIFTGEFLNTKIALGDKENGVYPAEWEADDQLAIYDAASNTLLGTAAITSESVGQRMGTFVLNQSIADGTKVKVVYPATEISGVAAEQTKASAADKHLIAKAESEEVTIQNQQAAFALAHQNAIVKVDVNSSEFAGKLLKSVTIYSAGATIANESDYARVTFTAPAAVSASETQSAVFMTLPVATDTDFYVSVKLVDAADELRTISIPKKFTAKQLKAGQVNTIPFTSLATTDNAVAWYNPVCNRYIPEGGWCYGNSNTYMCSTTIGTTGTFDVRACGDFLDVIKNAKKPAQMRNRCGDIVNSGTSGVWSINGVKPGKGKVANIGAACQPPIKFNVNQGPKNGVAGFFDLIDGDGNTIWAFVLWAINDDSAVNYTAGSVMKYNLGGGKNDGDNSGALYQWGRPFPFGYGSALQTFVDTLRITSFKQSAENAISPGLIIDSNVNADWLQDGTHKNDLWGNPTKGSTSTGGKKSIFDPCPQGWKVASVALLTEICNTGAIVTGSNFTAGTDLWPRTRYRAGNNGSLGGSGKGLYWADNANSDTHGQLFEFSTAEDGKAEIKSTWKSNACGVRCMKDTENR